MYVYIVLSIFGFLYPLVLQGGEVITRDEAKTKYLNRAQNDLRNG